MKYIKFIFLGAFVVLIVIPAITSRKIRVQRVSGEVRAGAVIPVVSPKVVKNEVAGDPNDDTSESDINKSTASSVDTLEEGFSIKRPAAKYAYQLYIPDVSVDAPVLGLGLEPNGKMDVPDNYEEVGWYSLGKSPGEVGNAVFGAHVDDGGSIDGVFKNLKKLQRGDYIYTTDGGGKTLKFKVTKIKKYDYRVNDTSNVFGSNGRSQLVLITCDGTFLPEEGTYSQRLIVFAELV